MNEKIIDYISTYGNILFNPCKTGDNILALLKKHNVSMYRLAEILGVSACAVSMWCDGQRIISTKNACAIAKLFNVPLNEILAY